MAFLIDSNIIIYSHLKGYQYLRDLITNESACVSEISRVEVLGYHKLKSDEEQYFLDVFDFITVILPSQDIFDKAIAIRNQYNLKLGDSIVAATAVVHSLELHTRNVDDFEKIKGLKYINPIK